MPVNKSANLQSLSRAIEVLEVCHGMKLTVPDDIVLLSVDNDEMLCNSASPRLSSLATSVRGCGFNNTNYLKILFCQRMV